MAATLLFRLAVAALMLALTLPRMAQRGMFGDGLVYATIARNLSLGVGSFWAPTYTQTAWTEFFEHPPLGLALQAAAFWLLGDHLIVERFFALLVFALHAVVIAAIWRRTRAAYSDWLPLLFWLLPSIVTWAVVNNMLENVQALFTSVAVLLFLAAARAPTALGVIVPSAVAGVAVVAAVLTKGPVGFFPLAAPLLFHAFRLWPEPDARGPSASKRLSLMLSASLLIVGLCGVALMAYAPARRNLTMYVMTHLAPVLQGRREVSDPLAVVRHLVMGIVGRMTALLALCWWLGRRGGATAVGAEEATEAETAEGAEAAATGDAEPQPPSVWVAYASSSPRGGAQRRMALCFLALGVCAAGPIAISPKVSGHYLLPSVPFFALGFASVARGLLDARRVAAPGAGALRLAAAVLVVAAVVAVVFRSAGTRDAATLRDLDAIAAAMPRGATIGACQHPRSARDWGLHTYVQRWYRVSLDARDVPVGGWLLREGDACVAPPTCVAVARGETLTLFRCDSRARASPMGE